MSGINPNESVAKAPESIQLEWCLDAQNEASLIQI
jgi:hypothetical protein